MHYYQFNIKTYSYATKHLSNMEDLAYRRLIDLYYDGEKPLANDIKKLAKKIGMREFQAEIKEVLSEFFLADGDTFMHEKADKEIAAYHSRLDVARSNGKKGGRPKQTQSKPKPNPEITQSVNLANPNLTTLKANQEPITNNNKQGTILKDLSPIGSPVSDDNEDTQKSLLNDLSAYEKMPTKKPNYSTEINELFTYWCEVMDKKTNTALSDKRKSSIKKRLSDGYLVSDIKTAIFNCSNTDHNMGTGPKSNGVKYNDIELICRTPENLERFRDNPGSGRSKQDNDEFDRGGLTNPFDKNQDGKTYNHDSF